MSSRRKAVHANRSQETNRGRPSRFFDVTTGPCVHPDSHAALSDRLSFVLHSKFLVGYSIFYTPLLPTMAETTRRTPRWEFYAVEGLSGKEGSRPPPLRSDLGGSPQRREEHREVQLHSRLTARSRSRRFGPSSGLLSLASSAYPTGLSSHVVECLVGAKPELTPLSDAP